MAILRSKAKSTKKSTSGIKSTHREYREWTEDELKKLILFNNGGSLYKNIAKALQRTKASVKSKMGFLRKNKKSFVDKVISENRTKPYLYEIRDVGAGARNNWSDRECSALTRYYNLGYSTKEMSSIMGRSGKSIAWKVTALGIGGRKRRVRRQNK
ncbi:uncharacterized protein KGF55_001069 [Candida pseudojiufengensis]|uniref:uncharacterized protein n=1 Tax=Candida pseudojiufengensis TaxID=497109 RepID=UPI0022243B10|nr:uncharacterized protein KGF55_001069 [Candida pseudojiufengensis]KAI5965707.1 hypothetical protein KGF55_001069 [Candida pseudojiufengensis]